MDTAQNAQADIRRLVETLHGHCTPSIYRDVLPEILARSSASAGSDLKIWAGCSGLVLTFEFYRDHVDVSWKGANSRFTPEQFQMILKHLSKKEAPPAKEALCA